MGSVKKVRSKSVQGCSVMQTGDFMWEVKEYCVSPYPVSLRREASLHFFKLELMEI